MRAAGMCSAALIFVFALLFSTAVFFIVQCQMEKPEDLLGSHVKHPQSIAVDNSAGKMFVVDFVDQRILRTNLEGGDVAVLGGPALQLQQPHSVAVDLAARKVYWTDFAAGRVQRSSYHGEDIEDVVVGLDQPAGIAVVSAGTGSSPVPNARVIWASHGHVMIQTVTVQPTSPAVPSLVRNISSYGAADDIFGVAADGDYVYWTQPISGSVQRALFSGEGRASILVEGLERPEGIAVDASDGLVYWSDPGAGRIGRASISTDTANAEVEFVIVSSEEPRGLALDEAGSLYYGDSSAQVVRRSGVNGECALYRMLKDEMIALIILVSAVVVAVLGCCVVLGLFVRSCRLEAKPTDNNADDQDTQQGTTKQDSWTRQESPVTTAGDESEASEEMGDVSELSEEVGHVLELSDEMDDVSELSFELQV